MTISIQDVLDMHLMDNNCFNPENFDYQEKINIVKQSVGNARQKFNLMFDILERNAINKLCHESKEFKMKQMRKVFEEKVEEFHSKTN